MSFADKRRRESVVCHLPAERRGYEMESPRLPDNWLFSSLYWMYSRPNGGKFSSQIISHPPADVSGSQKDAIMHPRPGHSTNLLHYYKYGRHNNLGRAQQFHCDSLSFPPGTGGRNPPVAPPEGSSILFIITLDRSEHSSLINHLET